MNKSNNLMNYRDNEKMNRKAYKLLKYLTIVLVLAFIALVISYIVIGSNKDKQIEEYNVQSTEKTFIELSANEEEKTKDYLMFMAQFDEKYRELALAYSDLLDNPIPEKYNIEMIDIMSEMEELVRIYATYGKHVPEHLRNTYIEYTDGMRDVLKSQNYLQLFMSNLQSDDLSLAHDYKNKGFSKLSSVLKKLIAENERFGPE